MQKLVKGLRCVFSVSTVGIVLLLCWQCLAIYLAGNHPDNIHAGVYISPVYSAEIVAERLAMVLPFLVIYGLIAVATVIVQIGWGTALRSAVKIRPCPPRAPMGRTQNIIRIVIACLGVLFIAIGVTNGGARDVLVKAINICTECIGLG